MSPIFPTSGVYCNTYHSNPTIQKLGFLHHSITTNDEPMLLTIEGKWLEVIVHMTKFKFLDLLRPKQVQLHILICIHGKFHLLITFTLISFQKDL
jgi:hypothetical protein